MLGSLRCATASLVWKTPVASATISEAHLPLHIGQGRGISTQWKPGKGGDHA